MADFHRKKLQVFVSSTFSDLIKERQAAVEAVLTAGHIPAGMELFTAGDESQMEVIKQWIDESDVYLLILGGRYGSIESISGKSYTQLEYEYAISKAKPFFACVIKDAAIEARVKAEGRGVVEIENSQKLKDFRTTVLSKIIKFWDDTKDIKIAVSETLAHFARREELVGWVRANSQSDMPAIADEITRLSRENAQLRTQVADGSQGVLINGLTFSELRNVLEKLNLLEFLVQNRHLLASGIDPTLQADEKRMRQLRSRGLVDFQGIYYRLSASGQIFLNKLEAVELASKPVSQSARIETAS